MSKLTEQLREALKKTTDGKWDGISTLSVMINGEPYGQDGNEEFCILAHNLLPALLTEYEKLERENEEAEDMYQTLIGIHDVWFHTGVPISGEDIWEALTAYRSACEK